MLRKRKSKKESHIGDAREGYIGALWVPWADFSGSLLHSLWNSALLRERLVAGCFCSVSYRPGLSFVTVAAGCQAARRLYVSPIVWHFLCLIW